MTIEKFASASAQHTTSGGAIPHISGLDGLRGVAILLVLLHHFGIPANFRQAFRWPIGEAFHRILDAGWAGVDLFFVISGFLITSILLASKNSPSYFRLFYLRRALRILPLHFGILTIGAITLPYLQPPFADLGGQSMDHLGWLFFYMSNLAMAFAVVQTFGVFDTLWSLAIEEQFYLIWPWVVRQISAKALVLVCLSLMTLSPFARALWLSLGYDFWGAYRLTFMRLDGLALGSLVAVAYAAGDKHWSLTVQLARLAWLPLFGLLVFIFFNVSAFYPSSSFVLVVGHSLLSLFFSSVLVLAIGSRNRAFNQFLTMPWLTQMGLYSYGIYVVHWPLLLVAQAAGVPTRMGVGSSIAATTLFLSLGILSSVALGAVTYHGYEKHFLKLRKAFSYSKQGRET